MLNIPNKVKFKRIAIVGIVSVITASTVATIVHASSIDIDKKQKQEQAIEQKLEQEMVEEERIRDEASSNKVEEQKDVMRDDKGTEEPIGKIGKVDVETNTDSFVDERTGNEQDVIDKLEKELKQVRSYIVEEEKANTQSTDNVNLEILRKREKVILAKLDNQHKKINDRNKRIEDLNELRMKHSETIAIEREEEVTQRETDIKDAEAEIVRIAEEKIQAEKDKIQAEKDREQEKLDRTQAEKDKIKEEEEIKKANKFPNPVEFITNLFTADGKSMDIPNGNTSNKTYMSYHAITMKSSPQYKLQRDGNTTTDEYGLRRRGEDYVIALGSYYGTTIGQRYQISFESGTTITATLGDCKSNRHTDAKGQQHYSDGSVVEFVTDSSDILNSNIKRRGSVSAHPGVNFQGNVVSIQKIK